MIHTVKGFGIVNQAEIDVFLELSCFFDDPGDVDNLISGSSAFSKTSLNIREFMYCWSLAWRIWGITLLACEMSAIMRQFEHSLGLLFFWDWNEGWPFPVLWPLLSLPNLLAYWVQHFPSIIFQDLKQLNWNPSPPLALFVVAGDVIYAFCR